MNLNKSRLLVQETIPFYDYVNAPIATIEIIFQRSS